MVTGWGRIGEEGEDRERVDGKRQKVVGRENNGLYKKRRKCEGGKNRDKKIVMEKLIIKKNRYNNNKKFSLLTKSSEVTPWCPVLVFALGILCFVLKSAASLVGQLGGETVGGYFFFPAFLDLMGCLLQVGALNRSHQVTDL
jgi:hypothetical protein